MLQFQLNQVKQYFERQLFCTDGLVQDCSNSIANALEILQSCTQSSIYKIAWRSIHISGLYICNDTIMVAVRDM